MNEISLGAQWSRSAEHEPKWKEQAGLIKLVFSKVILNCNLNSDVLKCKTRWEAQRVIAFVLPISSEIHPNLCSPSPAVLVYF